MDIQALVEKVRESRQSIQQGKFIGRGSDGEVYPVDDKTVLKLYNRWHPYRSNRDDVLYDFDIGRDLHLRSDLRLQDLQVPYYYGIFPPQEEIPELNHWGVFMERIHGVKYDALPALLKLKAHWQYRKQKKLVESIGYILIDSGVHYNTLFDLEKEKLFLIDLTRWQKIG